MKSLVSVSTFSLLTLLVAPLSAQTVIQGVAVTATSQWTNDWVGSAVNLTNNSGLSAPYDVTATHSPSTDAADQWHNNAGIDPDPRLVFDLGGSFDLDALHIWNGNQTFFTNRGVQQFDVWVSSDNGVTWVQAFDDAILAQSPGGTSVSAQSFDLTGFDGVTHLEIAPVTNYGDAYTGLAEVMFTRVAGTPYEEYVSTWGLAGGDADPAFDHDGDGLANAIEFVLGTDPTTDSAAAAPGAGDETDHLVFSFRRSVDSIAENIVVEYGSTLGDWTPAQAGIDGMTVDEETGYFEPGIDRVTVRIPKALASGSKLFARLAVDVATTP